jgi:hypothetical protein
VEENDDDVFADDEQHAIPYMYSLDVNVVRKGGGAALVIIIATPLKGDKRSQERLVRKIDNYLGYTKSAQFQAESGVATRENTQIVVNIHPGSDPEIFHILELCALWVQESNVSLKIETHSRK